MDHTKKMAKFLELKECEVKCRSKRHLQEMMNAVTKGTIRQVQLYLATCHNALSGTDLYGRTVLHVAASLGSTELLHWLLTEKNPDRDARDLESSWTALHRAVFYGQISAARMLLSNNANLQIRDNEGLTPLDILIKDRLPFVELTNSGLEDVYSWGNNSNFTLGHDGAQSRKLPEVIEVFRKNVVSIKQVIMNQYHTVFLSTNGHVYTCGHGQGGRLGHGNEQTCLTPKLVESLVKETCVKIAASRDNTFMLTQKGVVFSCGLNEHQQLGQLPPPTMSLLPKQIGGKKLRRVHIAGVCSQRFHTVIYNKDDVYTFGLNAGQLGHIKVAGETMISQPRLVSTFNYDSVQLKEVVTCQTATLVITTKGDLHLMYQSQCRRILSRNIDVVKVCICGGELDSTVENETQSPQKTADELTVVLLTSTGKVHLWRASWKRMRRCNWDVQQQLFVSYVVLTNNCLAFTTREGQAYTAGVPKSKLARNVTMPSLKEQQASLPPTECFNPSLTTLVAWDDIVELNVSQIPLVHRGTSIAADNKGYNLAVLQVQPHASLTEIPLVSESIMSQVFTSLQKESEPYDNIHDVILRLGHQQIAAHKYVLASRSVFFRKMFLDQKTDVSQDPRSVVDITNAHPYVFKQMISYIYTDTCDVLGVGCNISLDSSEADDEQLSIHQGNTKVGDKMCSDPLKLLHELAVRFGVQSLQKKLECLEYKGGKIHLVSGKRLLPVKLKFDRKKFGELCDVAVKASDDIVVSCHKCILVARSEYFNKMLSSGWIEASQTEPLSLPVTGDVLRIIIEYLYTDDSALMDGCRDMEFACNVLVTADQLLISRLKEVCEVSLAGMITLKSCSDLLEFASLYCADQLVAACQQFIIINLPTLLEAGSLNVLSDEVAEKLTAYYRDQVPGMQKRILGSPGGPPSAADLEELDSDYRNLDLDRVQFGHSTARRSAPKSKRHKSHRRSIDDDQIEKKLERTYSHEDAEPKTAQEDIQRSVSVDPEQACLIDLEKKDIEHVQFVKCGESEKGGGDIVVQSDKSDSQHTNEKIPQTNNDYQIPDDVGADDTSMSNLRDIIAQEEKLSATKSKNTTIRQSKKITKLSQKAKKKIEAERQKAIADDEKIIETKRVTPTNPWSPVEKVVKSFRELMNDDQVDTEDHLPVETEAGNSIPSSPLLDELLINLPSPEAVHQDTSAVSTSPVDSPWQRQETASQPAIGHPFALADIMQQELQQEVSRDRAANKSLSLIQIEDQAIQELLQYYSKSDPFGQKVTIDRIAPCMAQPHWAAKQK